MLQTVIFQASSPKVSPKKAKPRLKLLKRADDSNLPPIQLTPRDLDIIEAVYSFRVLTSPQIESLLFPGDHKNFQAKAKNPQSGKANCCRRRLKLLYHHGYLYREELPTPLSFGRRPLVYFLDKRGRAALCDRYGLQPKEIEWQPRNNTVSDNFIEHLLKSNDVRVAMTVAAKQNNSKIVNWMDDRTLHKQQNKDYVTIQGPQGGKPRRVAIVPDGYCHLQTPQFDAHFLLEIDRRTVVGQYSRWGGKDWFRKIQTYIAYFTPQTEDQTSLYEQRYKTSKLRVLTVTTGPTRLANLKRITEQAGGRKRFWFTTF